MIKTMGHTVHDDASPLKVIRLDTVDSTNNYLRSLPCAEAEGATLVTADYQTAGRGAYANKWESERGKNLLFSLQFCPKGLPATEMFVLSEVAALAVSDALMQYADGIKVKWPNDIYCHDRKMVGLLIENDLAGKSVSRTVIGAGVNVNQTAFLSDAPNPVSLAQVLGHEVDRQQVLDSIVSNIMGYLRMVEHGFAGEIHALYLQRLYRRGERHMYSDAAGTFQAVLTDVEPTGHLLLTDDGGTVRRYAFKEVAFMVSCGKG